MNAPPDRPGGMGRPVAVLASGTVAAFLIGYAAKIVLLRLYGPSEFGVFDFVLAAVGILLPISSLRYEDAVVLPEEDERARDLLLLAALLTAAAVAIAAVLVLPGRWLLHRLGMIEPARWLWSVPVLLLVLRTSKLGELWLVRRERFGRLARGNVTQAAVTTASRIAAGVTGAGSGGLLGGFGLGHAAGAAVYGAVAIRDLRRVPGRPTWAGLRAEARRHRRFAVFSTPATLVSALVTRLPYLFLLYYFAAEVVGYFGQAFNVLYVPLSLVTAAVGQVFFVRAARAAGPSGLEGLAARVHDRLVQASLFPVVVAAAAAPDAFSVLFGEQWRMAGRYAIWLAAWIALTAIGSPLTRLFDVLRRQRTDLAVNLLLLSATLAALVAGGRSGDVVRTLGLLGVLGASARAVQIVVALRAAGVRPAVIVRPYVTYGLASVPFATGLAVLSGTGRPLVTTVACGAVLALFGVHVARREGLLQKWISGPGRANDPGPEG